MSRRPELMSPPEIFYNSTEAKKYTQGSRMIEIQSRLSKRAIQLLNLPGAADGNVPPCCILDIGCGSGLSGECLEEAGHTWVGMDISPDMLNVAVDRGATATCGDVSHGDMGQGFPFRPGMFDGAISISALQWLFYPAKKCHNPHKRLMCFFQSLYAVLHRGARAVLQFYPETPIQMEMAVRCATQCGFTGGLVVRFFLKFKSFAFLHLALVSDIVLSSLYPLFVTLSCLPPLSLSVSFSLFLRLTIQTVQRQRNIF